MDPKQAFERYTRQIGPFIEEYDTASKEAFAGARLPEREWLALVQVVFDKWSAYLEAGKKFWLEYERNVGLRQ